MKGNRAGRAAAGVRRYLTHGPPLGRSSLRVGIAALGLLVWVLVRQVLAEAAMAISPALSLLDGLGIGGALALVLLLPLWDLTCVGLRRGVRHRYLMFGMTAVLLSPFVVIVIVSGLEPTSWDGSWAISCLTLLLLAAAEEVLCRGFLMDSLSVANRRSVGLLLSGILFGVLHVGNESATVLGIMNIILAGIFFGILRLISGGLVYPVLVHWVWNLLTGMVVGWRVSGYADLPSLYRPAKSPPWGGFGPEGSLLFTFAVVFAIGLAVVEGAVHIPRGRRDRTRGGDRRKGAREPG